MNKTKSVVLENPDTGKLEHYNVEKVLWSRRVVCTVFRISDRTLSRLIQDGVLVPETKRFFGRQYFDSDENCPRYFEYLERKIEDAEKKNIYNCNINYTDYLDRLLMEENNARRSPKNG